MVHLPCERKVIPVFEALFPVVMLAGYLWYLSGFATHRGGAF